MRVRGVNATLVTAEGSSPPLPFIELEDGEAQALIALGIAEDIDGVLHLGEELIEAPVEPVIEPVIEPVVDGTNSVSGDTGTVAGDEPVVGQPGEDAVPSVRQAAIMEIFAILGDEDLVQSGPRKGKPKVSAVEAATGFTDVTADEVDALFDADAV